MKITSSVKAVKYVTNQLVLTYVPKKTLNNMSLLTRNYDNNEQNKAKIGQCNQDITHG